MPGFSGRVRNYARWFLFSKAIVKACTDLKIIGGLAAGVTYDEWTPNELYRFGKYQGVSHFIAERPVLRRIVFKNSAKIERLLSKAAAAEAREKSSPSQRRGQGGWCEIYLAKAIAYADEARAYFAEEAKVLCPIADLTAKLPLKEVCIESIVGKPIECSVDGKETPKVKDAIDTGCQVGIAWGSMQRRESSSNFKPGNVLSSGVKAYKKTWRDYKQD